jgi:imidazolonepropionase-like amidohydrolase
MMIRSENLGFLTSCLLVATAVMLPAPLPAQQQPTFFRNARIFDGERVLERHDLVVEGGLIARVGRGLTVPDGAVVIDATGRTLLPGLIDAHTHTFGDGLGEALIFGVTTHLDMFTDADLAHTLRGEQRAGTATGRADLFSAGTMITAPRGHGTQFGLAIPTLTSPDSAQPFVDARLAEGSDWIKLAYDDGHAYGMTMPTLDLATLRAAIEATQRRDRLAVVHVGDAASAREAIEAGANGLVHLFTDREPDRDFARLVATRRAFVIPTLTVLRSIAGTPGGAPLVDDERLEPYLLPTSRTMLTQAFQLNANAPARSYAAARTTVRQLKAAGVPILAGSDAPNPGTAYGSAMHRELELLVEAGLKPAEALAAATSAPARAFGLADRGRIAPGLRADLVLVEGDPTRDIMATRAIVGVWKAGIRTDREGFVRQVAAASAAARHTPADLADGLVSDFERGETDAALGSWLPSPDNFAGGNSTGILEVVAGGANGSRHALQISGTIGDAVPFAWYGAMWTPGAQPMSSVDLSTSAGFTFWTKGDGKTYRVMIFAQSRGFEPLTRTFVAGAEWSEVAYSWADFGIDGSDLMGLVVAGGPQPGAFGFLVDDLRLR